MCGNEEVVCSVYIDCVDCKEYCGNSNCADAAKSTGNANCWDGLSTGTASTERTETESTNRKDCDICQNYGDWICQTESQIIVDVADWQYGTCNVDV